MYHVMMSIQQDSVTTVYLLLLAAIADKDWWN